MKADEKEMLTSLAAQKIRAGLASLRFVGQAANLFEQMAYEAEIIEAVTEEFYLTEDEAMTAIILAENLLSPGAFSEELH